MIDIMKAQIQSAKLIAKRATNAVSTSLENYKTTTDSRVQSLESYRTAQENSNAPGASTTFNGEVIIAEELTVQGAATVKGEEIATKNFVLANSGGGSSTGNTEMTKTYRAVGDGIVQDFEFKFIGSSVGIYRNGFKLDSTDFTLTNSVEITETITVSGSTITLSNHQQDVLSIKLAGVDYELDGVVYSDNTITLNEDNNGVSAEVVYMKLASVNLTGIPDNGDIINMVSYGGADFYSKVQADAQFMSRDTIINNFLPVNNPIIPDGSNLTINGSISGNYLEFSSSLTAFHYTANEDSVDHARRFIQFDYTNNDSYPMITNRTKSGKVVLASGLSSGGSEHSRIIIHGGDGVQDVEFTTNANLKAYTGTIDTLNSNIITSNKMILTSSDDNNPVSGGALHLSGTSNALVFDSDSESSRNFKRITTNDGGGNWNFRAGHYYNGGEKSIDIGHGASKIGFSSDDIDGFIELKVAPKSLNTDDNIAWASSLELLHDNRIRVLRADLEIQDIDKGVILRSPDNSRWKLTVNDDGSLSTNKL